MTIFFKLTHGYFLDLALNFIYRILVLLKYLCFLNQLKINEAKKRINFFILWVSWIEGSWGLLSLKLKWVMGLRPFPAPSNSLLLCSIGKEINEINGELRLVEWLWVGRQTHNQTRRNSKVKLLMEAATQFHSFNTSTHQKKEINYLSFWFHWLIEEWN